MTRQKVLELEPRARAARPEGLKLGYTNAPGGFELLEISLYLLQNSFDAESFQKLIYFWIQTFRSSSNKIF